MYSNELADINWSLQICGSLEYLYSNGSNIKGWIVLNIWQGRVGLEWRLGQNVKQPPPPTNDKTIISWFQLQLRRAQWLSSGKIVESSKSIKLIHIRIVVKTKPLTK